MNKKLKKKKGFTLIELIIVIAILGILALIAIPKFGEAQKDAKIKADIATAKTIADTTATLVASGEISDTLDLTKIEDVKGQKSTNKTVIINQLGNGRAEPQALNVGKFYVKVQDGNVSVIVKGTGQSPKEYTLYPKADSNYPDK